MNVAIKSITEQRDFVVSSSSLKEVRSFSREVFEKVNINQDLERINSELYKNYKWDLEVDHINLLYVVLTRAEKELYIFSDKNLDGKGNEKINFYSGIFISFLKRIC